MIHTVLRVSDTGVTLMSWTALRDIVKRDIVCRWLPYSVISTANEERRVDDLFERLSFILNAMRLERIQ